MNAEPLLNRIAKVFAEHRLEAVMVGNAAAALQGAAELRPDVVLVDIMLAQESGLTLARRLVSEEPRGERAVIVRKRLARRSKDTPLSLCWMYAG